ncbi:MAG: ATP-binding cassette domain-containing protein [Chloroflexi bacterium]|nr:ATP-binding cassette domain-containing protein [Chloroflexota bacterium]
MIDAVVRIQHLAHTYLAGTPLAAQALIDASLTVLHGSVTAVVGPNGAGKSTLLHFINALVRPASDDQVQVLGLDTHTPSLDIGVLRRRVGLVMQYPQQQLFERFVGDDIAFGPRQEGLQGEALRKRVFEAMEVVGLNPLTFIDRHTFSLSGGEMRRVALAGVLAMQPELLILDEVTTGLDPRGRKQVHELLRNLRDRGITVVFASNDMDEVLEIADHMAVLYQGRTVAEDIPTVLFNSMQSGQWGLLPPAAMRIRQGLVQAGIPLPPGISSLSGLEEALWQVWRD